MEQREDSPIEVTDENFGDLLIAGLREALTVERGELQLVRRVIAAGKEETRPS